MNKLKTARTAVVRGHEGNPQPRDRRVVAGQSSFFPPHGRQGSLSLTLWHEGEVRGLRADHVLLMDVCRRRRQQGVREEG